MPTHPEEGQKLSQHILTSQGRSVRLADIHEKVSNRAMRERGLWPTHPEEGQQTFPTHPGKGQRFTDRFSKSANTSQGRSVQPASTSTRRSVDRQREREQERASSRTIPHHEGLHTSPQRAQSEPTQGRGALGLVSRTTAIESSVWATSGQRGVRNGPSSGEATSSSGSIGGGLVIIIAIVIHLPRHEPNETYRPGLAPTGGALRND